MHFAVLAQCDRGYNLLSREHPLYRPREWDIEKTRTRKAMNSERSEPLFGEEAAALRKAAGLTQAQLAARWGLSRSQIGRYERTGESVPPKEADAYRGLAILARK